MKFLLSATLFAAVSQKSSSEAFNLIGSGCNNRAFRVSTNSRRATGNGASFVPVTATRRPLDTPRHEVLPFAVTQRLQRRRRSGSISCRRMLGRDDQESEFTLDLSTIAEDITSEQQNVAKEDDGSVPASRDAGDAVANGPDGDSGGMMDVAKDLMTKIMPTADGGGEEDDDQHDDNVTKLEGGLFSNNEDAIGDEVGRYDGREDGGGGGEHISVPVLDRANNVVGESVIDDVAAAVAAAAAGDDGGGAIQGRAEETECLAGDEEDDSDGVLDDAKEWFGELAEQGMTLFQDSILLADENDPRPDTSVAQDEDAPPSAKPIRPLGDILGDILAGKRSDHDDEEGAKDDDTVTSNNDRSPDVDDSWGLVDVARGFRSFVAGGSGENDDTSAQRGFLSIVSKARDSNARDSDVRREAQSFVELATIFLDKTSEAVAALSDNFSHIDLRQLDVTALWYYVELEDERKTPSWKRIAHRYEKLLDVEDVENLNDDLHLAKASYEDTVEDIRRELSKARESWELVYCNTKSLPEAPSHFVAVRKGQSHWSDSLDVLMVVRGTKGVEDILTDALFDTEDFRGGEAHGGMYRSGKYLVKKHSDLLQRLLDMSDKEKVNLKLVGHSLGAGAASIAAMDWNDTDNIEARVTCFGPPAFVSETVSKGMKDYVTSVIVDADVVPRMSAATVANLALDVMEFDYTDRAKRDVDYAIRALKRSAPDVVSPDDMDKAVRFVDSLTGNILKPRVKKVTSRRLEPCLFPPGTCIHFYRDGRGISGSYVPCTFFHEIDASRTMIRDHSIIAGYTRIFLELMRDHYEDYHFKFEV